MKNGKSPKLSFTSERNMSKLLSAGTHRVTIASVEEAESNESAEHTDRTPQMKVVFVDAEGRKFTHWFNLRGFKRFEDFDPKAAKAQGLRSTENGIAVDKKGLRIEDEERTEKALKMISALGCNAGIPEGTDFGPEDLVGQEVGLVLKQEDGRSVASYAYSMPADKVQDNDLED